MEHDMSEKQETVADIVAEMKRFAKRHWMHDEGQNIRVFAERIEAAHERELAHKLEWERINADLEHTSLFG